MITQKKLCIIFLTTRNEIISGSLLRTIEYYNTFCNSEYSYDLKIFLDNKNSAAHNQLQEISRRVETLSHVNDIEIIDNEIPGHLNIVLEATDEKFDLNTYSLGRTHGINQHFYSSANHMFMSEYENFLLLESDTKPVTSNWLTNIIEFCDTRDFVIAGSTYKGVAREQEMKKYYGPHLNGVAIYKNSKKCKDMIELSKQYIQSQLKHDYKNSYRNMMNYDVALYLCCKEENVLENLLDTDIITNVSTFRESKLPVDRFIKQYPGTVIIHKKNLY